MDDLYSHLALYAEPMRVRLLSLLEHEELGVSELCRIVQLPQSTVSRHLKSLQTGGLLRRRADGTRSLYRMNQLHGPSDSLWRTVADSHRTTLLHGEDQARLKATLESRTVDSNTFFGRVQAGWDTLRSELFGESFLQPALAAMLPPNAVVADLGCGTGATLQVVAPWVEHAIGIDREPAMLRAAAQRLRDIPNVSLLQGPLEALPINDANTDIALCTLVLHHVEDPFRVFLEARRILRPGGQLIVVDMVAHDRADWRHTMGHRWLGFSSDQLREWGDLAGLGEGHLQGLTPTVDVQGPPLQVARWRL